MTTFTFLSPIAAMLGALVGGCMSLVAAVYTQRHQDRLQRIATEVAKREAVYADFVIYASHLLLNAYVRKEIELSGDEQQLLGLINRMRFFAPQPVVSKAEEVFRSIVEIALKPSVELRELAKETLSKGLALDPYLSSGSRRSSQEHNLIQARGPNCPPISPLCRA